MKIKVNAIGVGELKRIRLAEGLILSGAILTIAGLIYLRKTQSWFIGKTNAHFEYFDTVIESLQATNLATPK